MFKPKNHFKEIYEPQHSFVVRTPLFPIEQFFDWKTSEENIDAAKQSLRNYLKEFYSRPITQEALLIASPDLYDQLLLWLEGKIEKEEKRERAELSLMKYMIRMCTRCTPYGLFASCTAGQSSEETRISLS